MLIVSTRNLIKLAFNQLMATVILNLYDWIHREVAMILNHKRRVTVHYRLTKPCRKTTYENLVKELLSSESGDHQTESFDVRQTIAGLSGHYPVDTTTVVFALGS